MPGAGRHSKEMYRGVRESEEFKHDNENGEVKDNEDLNDTGIAAVNMASPQQPIISIEDEDFPSDEEKVEI